MTLSLCMIVKNEAEVLARALATAAVYADEIIVVDTGSTDGTRDIARRFTDKVYSFEWTGDFAAARNYAIGKASCDYWMWLDADDIVTPSAARGISRIMRTADKSTDIVMLPYVLSSDEKGKPLFQYFRERIIKNDGKRIFIGRVHEAVELSGVIRRSNYPIIHAKPAGRAASTRNLDIYVDMRVRGETFSPREKYYYARELFYNNRYGEAAEEFISFLNDAGGSAVNKVDACLMLSRCFSRQGRREEALSALYCSFVYGLPTGEVCCEIGLDYFSVRDYERAAYWFERAAAAKPDMKSGAFIDADCYGFLPNVWLTVCYDRMGKHKKAYAKHQKAKRLRPEHPSVVANEAYFNGVYQTKGG